MEIPLSEGLLPYFDFEYLKVQVNYPDPYFRETAEQHNTWTGDVKSNKLLLEFKPYCIDADAESE